VIPCPMPHRKLASRRKLAARRGAQALYAYCGLAFVHNLKGAYEQCAEYARLTAHNMPGWIFGWIHLAISSAYIGNIQEARAAAGRILELSPSFSVKQYRVISSPNMTGCSRRPLTGCVWLGSQNKCS
jgi:hypothetical protein